MQRAREKVQNLREMDIHCRWRLDKQISPSPHFWVAKMLSV